MELTTKVRESGPTPRGLMREKNEIARRVGSQVGADWHAYLLPKHFTVEGAREYSYQPRTYKHNVRKIRRFGAAFPLVFSGDSMRRLTGNSTPGHKSSNTPNLRVTATGGRARIRVILDAGNLNWRPNPRSPDMRSEVTRTSNRDEDFLADCAEDAYQQAIRVVNTSSGSVITIQ